MFQAFNIAALLGVMAIGLALMVLAYNRYDQGQVFIANAHRAEGRIIELQPIKNDDNNLTYLPTVRFTGPNGQAISFLAPSSSTPHPVGETVTVLYNPLMPQNAQLEGHRYDRGERLIFLLGFVIFMPIFIVMAIVIRRAMRRQ